VSERLQFTAKVFRPVSRTKAKTQRPPLRVVAGIVRRQGKLLIAKRKKDDALGGLWEFPGGKVEGREPYRRALARELEEELGVIAQIGAMVHTASHQYPERLIRLRFYECELLRGEPQPLESDEIRWVHPSELLNFEFPPADKLLLEQLARPASA
jgi:mutator protein MutT